MQSITVYFVVSFKAVGSQDSVGWPKYVIQAYYSNILSMNPLPWANSVDAEFGVAQFMAQEARPEKPSPAAS